MESPRAAQRSDRASHLATTAHTILEGVCNAQPTSHSQNSHRQASNSTHTVVAVLPAAARTLLRQRCTRIARQRYSAPYRQLLAAHDPSVKEGVRSGPRHAAAPQLAAVQHAAARICKSHRACQCCVTGHLHSNAPPPIHHNTLGYALLSMPSFR